MFKLDFKDICHELIAKGSAIRLVTPDIIGEDIQNVMNRAVEVIYTLQDILQEIKDEGTINSSLTTYAIKADEGLMLIKDIVHYPK